MPAYELVGEETSEGQAPRGRLIYRLRDIPDATTARAVAWAAAPVIFDLLLKQDAQITELGADQWDVDVSYGAIGSPDPAHISWSFDIGTASLHITQALEHVQSYAPPGKTAPDHKGAIGVVTDAAGSKKAEGVDVLIPVFTWQETHNLPAALIATSAWVVAMMDIVAHINEVPFRIWKKGELLLLGISGHHASLVETAVPVTFKFASSTSKTGLTIGDITGIDKEGNDYLWIEYEQVEDGAANALTARPLAAHVERVYDYAPFAGLGIGDPWS